MRRRNSSVRAILALAAFAAACNAQTPAAPPTEEKPASVAGEVRNSLTLAPVERAHVTLRRFANGAWERYGALTNAEGKFVINGLSAGSYATLLDRVGYVNLNQQSQTQLQAGEKKDGLKLKLTPTGAVTGRVLDADGAPMEGVSVHAELGTQRVRTASTDDQGVYRLGGLAPGKYRILAQQQKLPLPPEIRTDGTAEVNYAATYHPSAASPKNATRVDVPAGGDVTGADIRLVRTPVVRVSGKVSGVPAGAQNASVMLGRSLSNSTSGGQAKPDGSFEIWRVDPGKYTVRATHYGSGTQLVSAPIEIEVGENDVENIGLQLVAPAELRGTVEFEDEDAKKGPQSPQAANANKAASPQQPPKPLPRYVLLREIGGNVSMSAQLEESGAFALPRVQPGIYRVEVKPGSTYVKAMQLGTVHSDGGQLDIRSGTAGAALTLHVASATGTISGTIKDDKGPAAGVRVGIAEANLEKPTPRFAHSKPDGSYSFTGIAPGKYRILAVDESDTVLMNNQEDLEEVAEAIEIRDHEALVKDVKKRALPSEK